MVDNDGAARLGGFGSVSSPSLPASWSDIGTKRLFYGIAPELVNPYAFGLAHARTTKATDMFAFGMLAWEVSWVFGCFLISRSSPTGVGPRSSPENHRSPAGRMSK